MHLCQLVAQFKLDLFGSDDAFPLHCAVPHMVQLS